MNIARNLVRTQGGSVVHAAGCRYAVYGVRWAWADTVLPSAITRDAAVYGYRFCKVCKPLRDQREIDSWVRALRRREDAAVVAASIVAWCSL